MEWTVIAPCLVNNGHLCWSVLPSGHLAPFSLKGGKKAYQHSKGRGVFCDADAVGEGLLTGFLPIKVRAEPSSLTLFASANCCAIQFVSRVLDKSQCASARSERHSTLLRGTAAPLPGRREEQRKREGACVHLPARKTRGHSCVS